MQKRAERSRSVFCQQSLNRPAMPRTNREENAKKQPRTTACRSKTMCAAARRPYYRVATTPFRGGPRVAMMQSLRGARRNPIFKSLTDWIRENPESELPNRFGVKYAAVWNERPSFNLALRIYDKDISAVLTPENKKPPSCLTLLFRRENSQVCRPTWDSWDAMMVLSEEYQGVALVMQLLVDLNVPLTLRKAVKKGLVLKEPACATALGLDKNVHRAPAPAAAATPAPAPAPACASDDVECTGTLTWEEKDKALRAQAVEVDA